MSDVLPSTSALLSTLGVLAATALSVVLLAQILPIPDSPLVLGASAAVVYWALKTYVATDGG